MIAESSDQNENNTDDCTKKNCIQNGCYYIFKYLYVNASERKGADLSRDKGVGLQG